MPEYPVVAACRQFGRMSHLKRQAVGADADAISRIRALLPGLQPSDAKVAHAVLDDPRGTIYRSVTEVAEQAGTAASTVVRAAQALGYQGFQDLKLAIARQEGDLGELDLATDNDSPAAVLRSVTAAGAQAVRDAGALVDGQQFADAADGIHRAGRVLFVGVGTSAPLAQDAGYRFRTIGIDAEAPADVHVQHVAASLLHPGDVCFAISHSGASQEPVATLSAARDAGASTIVMSSFARSPLAELADAILVAGTREVSFRLEGITSRLAHSAVLDALLVAVAHRDPPRSRRVLELYAAALTEHRF